MTKQVEQLHADLARVIARHAGWLSGKQFQSAALHIAAAYFPADDLADLVDVNRLAQALEAEMVKAPGGRD